MKKLLLGIGTGLVVLSGQAQWVADPTQNTPVVTTAVKGTVSVSNMITAPDGDGGMFIAWTDSRNSATTGDDLFIIRLTRNGTIAPGFAAGGNLVCNAAGNQTNPVMLEDGNGGVNIVWQDPRDNATNGSDLYGIKVKGDGTLDGPVNGFVISNTSFGENTPVMASVGNDKVAVVWRFTGTTTSVDLAMNFVNFATKSMVLPAQVLISDKANAQNAQQVIGDGNGNAIIIWVDARVSTQNAQLFAQKVSQTGTLLWGPSGSEIDGLQLTNTSGNSLLPQMVSDGAGGAVIAFGSTRVATDNANIYAIRIDGSGNNVWTANGVNVCLANTTQSNTRIVKSGNKYVVAWADRRESTNPPSNSNNIDVFMQSLNEADGSANWTVDGIQVIKQPGSQPNSQTDGFELLDDGNGGAFTFWDDARIGTSDLDVYGQHVKSDATLHWPANGAPVSTRSLSNQNWPKAVKSLHGNVLVVFRDSRTATGAEIFASLVESAGVLPLRFLEVAAAVQSKDVWVTWTTSGETAMQSFNIERSADGFNFTQAGTITARNLPGVQQYRFTDVAPGFANGFYRIKARRNDGSHLYSATVKVVIPAQAQGTIQLFPNPAVSQASLLLNKLPAGSYRITVTDAAGRNVFAQSVQKGTDGITVMLPVQRLGAGLYRIVISDEKGRITAVETLMKR